MSLESDNRMVQEVLSTSGTPAKTLAERVRTELGAGDSSDEDHVEDSEESEEEDNEVIAKEPSPKKSRSGREGNKTGAGPNWQILETIWPAAERPAGPLTNKRQVESMTINSLLDIYKIHAEREKKESGQAIAKASKDKLPAMVNLAKSRDNCVDKLAVARWLRMPVSSPELWYKEVPTKRTEIYRNIPLKHLLGSDTIVAKNVIATMHDRRNALQMKHFNRYVVCMESLL